MFRVRRWPSEPYIWLESAFTLRRVRILCAILFVFWSTNTSTACIRKEHKRANDRFCWKIHARIRCLFYLRFSHCAFPLWKISSAPHSLRVLWITLRCLIYHCRDNIERVQLWRKLSCRWEFPSVSILVSEQTVYPILQNIRRSTLWNGSHSKSIQNWSPTIWEVQKGNEIISIVRIESNSEQHSIRNLSPFGSLHTV